MDANFKLKNRIRLNERDDPSLGPGWGAFVEPTRYREHLKKYVAESDVSLLSGTIMSQTDERYLLGQHLYRLRSADPKGDEKHGGLARVGSGGGCVREARVCTS
jgi:hypothetical protein